MAVAVGRSFSNWVAAGDLECTTLLRSHDRGSLSCAAAVHSSFALLELARSTHRKRISTLDSGDLLRHDRTSTYGCRRSCANRAALAPWQPRPSTTDARAKPAGRTPPRLCALRP